MHWINDDGDEPLAVARLEEALPRRPPAARVGPHTAARARTQA